MSSLKYSEKNILEKILEMKTGYVSDFSDRTLKEFVLDETGIDIYAEGYDEGGTSKANRIRTFWKRETDEVTANLVESLLRYAQSAKTDYDRELNGREANLFIEAQKIVTRLRDESAAPEKTPTFLKVASQGKIDGLVMKNNTMVGRGTFIENEGEIKDANLEGNRQILKSDISEPDRDTKEASVHPVERLTNNQTFAIVIGGLILLVIVFVIYKASGVNLSNLSS